jgi:hypothetical protein
MHTKIKMSSSISSLKIYDPETNKETHCQLLETTQTSTSQYKSKAAHRSASFSPGLSLPPPATTGSTSDNISISDLYSNINVSNKSPQTPKSSAIRYNEQQQGYRMSMLINNTPGNNKTANMSYNMNDLITDRIGKDFFNNVLGKANQANNIQSGNYHTTAFLMGNQAKGYTPNKNKQQYATADGPIRTLHGKYVSQIEPDLDKNLLSYRSIDRNGNLETTYFDSEQNLAFRETTLLTSDQSTLLTNDGEERDSDRDQSKKSSSSFKSVQSHFSNTGDNGDYMEVLDNEVGKENGGDIDTLIGSESSCTLISGMQSPVVSSIATQKENPAHLESKEKIQEQFTSLGYTSQLLEQLVDKLNTTSRSDIIESRMFTCFASPPVGTAKSEWREGHQKSAFNYILIDPRISQNLPARVRLNTLTAAEAFRVFVQSIFYIGKGSRARPYAHLYDSLKDWKEQSPVATIKSKKIQKIIQIWNDDEGIVSLHCFQSVIPSEAYTREAAMIDAMGLDKLTNKQKGTYYGESKEWDLPRKRQLGTILLKRACQIFLAEGERQITPNDI